jgi:Fe-S-cluster-containing dehydrogenase component
MHMADILRSEVEKMNASTDKVAEVIHKLVTRRQFLKGAGAAGLGATTFYLMGCAAKSSSEAEGPRQIYVADALGMIIAEPSRCVGCRRCELACSEYNDGVSQPAISRIKVGRNYNLGPLSAQSGLLREDGTWGNHRIVQDTCRQCPHPVPCQLACPHDAIEIVAPLNARVVNVDKCIGCGICTQACPWDMMSLDRTARKATKCNLCKECVIACPASALQYVAWSDKTKQMPPRVVVPAYINSAVASSCVKCH